MFARYPSLADRTALITGGATGIGAAMVDAFARSGARVAFLDVQEAPSRALVERLGDAARRPLFLACDLRDVASLRQAVERVRAELGPVAVLVNNAANDERHDLDAVTPGYWDESMAVNLRHQFFAAQAVRPQMREGGGGSIVNMSSIAWMGGGTRMIAYSSAKAAVVGMTRSLAEELGPEDIRVNAIAPGAVITERQRRLWLDEAQVEAIVARQCLKRTLLADEVARLALFLAADDSRMITKQTLVVDAGLR
jgi:NAD(P)-dependent dehydrogenase (short-subunit alcohol dehydrogenase family)